MDRDFDAIALIAMLSTILVILLKFTNFMYSRLRNGPSGAGKNGRHSAMTNAHEMTHHPSDSHAEGLHVV